VHTKFIEVSTIGGIQLPAAVICWVGVVIRHSFAAQVVVGAQHLTGIFCRPA